MPARVTMDLQAQESDFFVAGIVEEQLRIDEFSFSLTLDLLQRHLEVESVLFLSIGCEFWVFRN